MSFVVAKDGVRLHYTIHDYTDPWKDAPVLILQQALLQRFALAAGHLPQSADAPVKR